MKDVGTWTRRQSFSTLKTEKKLTRDLSALSAGRQAMEVSVPSDLSDLNKRSSGRDVLLEIQPVGDCGIETVMRRKYMEVTSEFRRDLRKRRGAGALRRSLGHGRLGRGRAGAVPLQRRRDGRGAQMNEDSD